MGFSDEMRAAGYLKEDVPTPQAEPTGPGFRDYASAAARALVQTVPATGAAAVSAIQGQSGVEAPGQEDIFEKGVRRFNKAQTEYEQQQAEKFPGATMYQALTRLPRQAGFSLTSMVPGIAAGVATAPVLGPGAYAAGSTTSGLFAYRSSSSDIMRSYVDTLDEQMRETEGRGLTLEETENAKADFSSKATQYGLWEAIPEAVGGAIAGRLIFGPLKKMVGEKLASTMMGKIGAAAGVVAEELSTEVATQIGQNRVLQGTPIADEEKLDWSPAGILEAAKQVAPDVLLLTGVLGGGAKAGSKLYQRRQESKLAGKLGINKQELKTRVQVLLETRQADPNFEYTNEDAMRFLAGAVVLKEGKFEAKAAPAKGEPAPQEPSAKDNYEQILKDTPALTALVDKIATATDQTSYTPEEQELQQTYPRRVEMLLKQKVKEAPDAAQARPVQEGAREEPVRDTEGVQEVRQDRNVAPTVDETSPQAGVSDSVGDQRIEKIAQEPVAQEPVAQEPVAQEPVVQEPVAQEPVVQEPVAQEPVVQEPVAQEPVVQAETEGLPRLKRGYKRETFTADTPSLAGYTFIEDTSTKGKKALLVQSKDGAISKATPYIVAQVGKATRIASEPAAQEPVDVTAAKIKTLHTRMSRSVGRTLPGGTYTAAAVPKKLESVVPSLTTALGKSIIFVKLSKDSPAFNGVTNVTADTIFVNVDSKKAHTAIVGHELLHELGRDFPEEYEQFKKIVIEAIPADVKTKEITRQAAWRKKAGIKKSRKELELLVEDELVADFFGEQFTKVAFWRKVAKRLPDSFVDFAQKFIDFIEKVKPSFKGPQLRELEKAQDAAASALALYFKNNPQVEQAFKNEQFSIIDDSFKRGVDKSSRLLKSALDKKSIVADQLPRILKVTPLQTLVDLGTKVVPRLPEYAKLVRAEKVLRDDIVDAAGVKANNALRLAKKGVGIEALHKVMSLGSYYQVTPWDRLIEQPWVPKDTLGTTVELLKGAQSAWVEAGMQESLGLTFRQAYDEASAAYDALKDPELQDAYIKIVEDIRAIRLREKNDAQALFEELTAGDADQGNLRRLLVQLEESFQNLRGAYMPLRREGSFLLEFVDPEGFKVSEAYESAREREEAKIALESVGVNPETFVEGARDEQQRSLASIPREFLEQVQSLIQQKYVEGIPIEDEEAISQAEADAAEVLQDVTQIFLRWAPETAAVKNSMRRKNVRGASTDMTRSYLSYMQSHASNVAYFEQGRKIDDVLKDIKQDIKEKIEEKIDTTRDTQILNDLKNRRAATKASQVGAVASFLGRASSLWYLTSPSIALVQMSQLGILTYPKLLAKFGATAAAKHLTQGTQKAMSRKYNRKALYSSEGDGLAVQTLFNDMKAVVTPQNRTGRQTLGDPIFSNEEIAKRVEKLTPYQQELLALRESMARGILDISLVHEVYALSKGADPNSVSAKVLKGMMVFMRHSELASRKAAILGTFAAARENGQGFFDAMDTTVDVANRTLHDFSPEAKGVLLQKGSVRVLLAFQHFRIMTTINGGLLIKDMFRGESKEVRRAAVKEFVAIMGMTSLMAGAAGLPIAWLWPLLDMIFGDEDEPIDSELIFTNWLTAELGGTAGKVAASGVGTLLGTNISRRIGLGSVGYFDQTPPESIHGDAYAAWLAQQALGPAYSILNGFIRAEDEIMRKGNYIRGLEAAVPKPMKDLLKAYRYASEGVKTGAGKRLIKDGEIDAGDLLMTALGFSPEVVFAAGVKNRKLGDMGTRISERRGRLIKDFIRAYKDGGGTQEEMDAITAFNKKMPEFAIRGQEDIRPAFGAMIKGDLMMDGRREYLVKQRYAK